MEEVEKMDNGRLWEDMRLFVESEPGGEREW